jgi:hypothetical protein
MDIARINYRNNFIFRDFPNYHPESMKYIEFWKVIKRRVIEGYWGQDTTNPKETGMWRFMPPQLYFYANLCYILHKKEGAAKNAPRRKVHPNLDDIDWDFSYKWLEARGFSGFSDDEEYTCCRDVELFHKGKLLEEDVPKSCYNKQGILKKYTPTRTYINKLFDKPLGLPLYDNEARNMVMLGSRGSGKSYFAGNEVILHEIITDGAKEYTEESIKNPAKVELFVGAAMASKSADLLEKTLMSLNNLPGIWKPGTDEEIPSPLYKRATGSLLQPSKVPWVCKYQKKFGGEWQWVGSHSSIKHGTWTTENPEAAAGGRYNVIVCEEFGLLPNSIQVHMSNIPTMYIEHKFGSALYLGTGGNIEKIQQSQTIFCEPESFECLEFDDIWENTGKIGYFIPATYSDRKFKDANGNTKVEEALAYYTAKREKARKAKSGNALDMEMQNYPLVPSEMFLNKNRNNYPLSDLKHRLAELLTNDKILNATYKGRFNIEENGEVKWKNEDLQPIREYPLKSDDSEGCVEMFYMPQRGEDGRIPYGRYIAALDPIDDDGNEDNNLSLQAFFIYDLWTEKIVLEFSARTRFAKDFYEQCRRGLIYYNARLLYENQKKGPFTYFDNKNSLYLLEDTPPELRDMDMQKGSTVGNKGKGIYGTPVINKWGRSELGPAWMNEQAVGKADGVTNCQTLLSVGLIREALLYNPDVNADRISAFGILMIYRELRVKYKPDKEAKAKTSYNEDKFFKRTYGYRNQSFYNS